MPLYGHELSESIDPYTAGVGWAVKLEKGDFTGRDALIRAKASRSTDAARSKRVGLELEGKRIARQGCRVFSGDREVGQVTSGTFSPTLQVSLAMAIVDSTVAATGMSLTVDVRGHLEPARVVRLPFYSRTRAQAPAGPKL